MNKTHLKKTNAINMLCHPNAQSQFELTKSWFLSDQAFRKNASDLLHRFNHILCTPFGENHIGFFNGWLPLLIDTHQKFDIDEIDLRHLPEREIELFAWHYTFECTLALSHHSLYIWHIYQLIEKVPDSMFESVFGRCSEGSVIKNVMQVCGTSRSQVRYQVDAKLKMRLKLKQSSSRGGK